MNSRGAAVAGVMLIGGGGGGGGGNGGGGDDGPSGGDGEGGPINAIIRWRRESQKNGLPRSARLLARLLSLVIVVAISGLTLTWVQVVHLSSGAFGRFPGWLIMVPVLGCLSLPMVTAVVIFSVRNWRNIVGTQWERIRYTMLAVVSMLYVLLNIHWSVIA